MIGYLSNKAGGRSGVPLSASSVAASPFSLRRLYSIKFSRTVVGYSVVSLGSTGQPQDMWRILTGERCDQN